MKQQLMMLLLGTASDLDYLGAKITTKNESNKR